ncbi:4-hydroxythreonine-4-phosphate dehydrogenase PdxA [Flavobacteriaceae bacterium F08102]|nr:4-hydroxythreonine-4-phosphate dehydrogenase PdxA [Flavobacteriaceae bacterium F08102]
MKTKSDRIKVGISVGDINGIGIEVILKTFQDKRMLELCTPVIFASNKLITKYKKATKIEVPTFEVRTIEKVQAGKLNVLNVWSEEVALALGTESDLGGKYAFKSLESAVKSLRKEHVDVLVTAPINKHNIQSDKFKFQGHTEFLEANLSGESLMILMCDTLKLGLFTGHIPVQKIAESIQPALIERKIQIMHDALQVDFNISKPKIAVLGLNPHCGDHGVIGNEDEEIVRPTIQKIYDKGQLVFGPYAADSFFGSETYLKFDGVMAMYHDQGLAPFKTLSFGAGVNYTAGLNRIRTSPDHGTAYEIAGKGIANHESFRQALYTAIDIFRARKMNLALKKNKLEITP